MNGTRRNQEIEKRARGETDIEVLFSKDTLFERGIWWNPTLPEIVVLLEREESV